MRIASIRLGVLAGLLALAASAPAGVHRGRRVSGLGEILARMNDASRHLKSVSANLSYTKVTVLVNDQSTESGRLLFRNGRTPEIRIEFSSPDRKVFLFRKNRGEIYLPKINQIQEYDLAQKGALVQQFLLLGFGTDVNELKKDYSIRYVREEDLQDESAALLELVPRQASVAAQITKLDLWVSEDSWLPAQQKFYEPGGDYLIASYTGVKVNRALPSSAFSLNAPADAKRVKMN